MREWNCEAMKSEVSTFLPHSPPPSFPSSLPYRSKMGSSTRLKCSSASSRRRPFPTYFRGKRREEERGGMREDNCLSALFLNLNSFPPSHPPYLPIDHPGSTDVFRDVEEESQVESSFLLQLRPGGFAARKGGREGAREDARVRRVCSQQGGSGMPLDNVPVQEVQALH